MTFATNYYAYIPPWPKELYDLREHLKEQVKMGRELIRSYLQHEILLKNEAFQKEENS